LQGVAHLLRAASVEIQRLESGDGRLQRLQKLFDRGLELRQQYAQLQRRGAVFKVRAELEQPPVLRQLRGQRVLHLRGLPVDGLELLEHRLELPAIDGPQRPHGDAF